MKKLTIHGKYTSDGQFCVARITGDTGGTTDDFNLAMQVLRVVSHESPVGMVWDVSNWDESEWN